MNSRHSRRSVMIAAAGLATSIVVAGCGHARGERATSDSATVTTSIVDTAATPATVTTTPSISTTTTTTTSPTTTTQPRRTRTTRRTSSVSAVPESKDSPNPSVGVRTSPKNDAADEIDASTSTSNRSVTTTTPSSTDMSASPSVTATVITSSACFAYDETAAVPDYDASERAAALARINTDVRGDSMEARKTPVRVDSVMSSAPPAASAAATSSTKSVVPCVTTGDRRGSAAGAFLNDAQVAHAFLIANTLDSAVSYAALRRTTNPAVRTYAEMMVRDHTAANQTEAQVVERVKIAPAQNELSNQMLADVLNFADALPVGTVAAVTVEPKPATPVTVTATTTTTTTATAVATDRDTLHLSNRFVAAANMQPWSSLLSGLSDSITTPVVERKVAVTTTTVTSDTTTPVVQVSAFDRRYADFQVSFHQKALDALDTRLIPWALPEQRTVLEQARPTVAAHLEAARNLQRSLSQGRSY